MLSNILENYGSFYLIGIGGVSMSSLAKFLLGAGKRVGGSDAVVSSYFNELKNYGAELSVGSSQSVAEYEVIVYTDAVRDTDPQLIEARSLQKTVISRGQLLYEVSKTFKSVIAVSGSHGKTTCTAMLSHVFYAAGKKFCAHIGGRDFDFGNYFNAGGDYFITEACEYKRNFLLLKPHTAVILNSRPDHLECYGSEEELKNAYIGFASSADVKICLYGDVLKDCLTFGFDKNAQYYAKNIGEEEGFYYFTAYEGDCMLGRINLRVYGKHNILNALAVIAVARSEQISFRDIKTGLEAFKGVERRFETLGNINGALWIADYAHHPDEIRASVRAVKKISPGKIYVVFQPHTYSRTKNLFKQFIKVLSPMNNLLIYRTFAAREYFDDAGSALTLSRKIKKSRYGNCARDIEEFTLNAGEGDIVLVLGAGDIYDIAKEIVKSR